MEIQTNMNSQHTNLRQLINKIQNSKFESKCFLDLPNSIHEQKLKYPASVKNLIVVGIGGSTNGTRAYYNMYKNSAKKNLYFVGDEYKQSEIDQILQSVKGDCALLVVSKSGSTSETLFAYEKLKNVLIEKYNEKYNKYIAVISIKDSKLHKIATENKYAYFEHIKDLSGRYSVLSNVGILPLEFVGFDKEQILQNVQLINQNEHLSSLIQLFSKFYKNKIVFLSSFDKDMQEFMMWLNQLISESLAKKNKSVVPCNIIYPQALHYIEQLIQQGEKNFCEIMINVHTTEQNQIKLRNALTKLRLNSKAQFVCITIDNKNDELAQLFFLFEILVASTGIQNKINPFNQDGVENYKKLLLNK